VLWYHRACIYRLLAMPASQHQESCVRQLSYRLLVLLVFMSCVSDNVVYDWKLRLSEDHTKTYVVGSSAVDRRHKRRREHRCDAYSDNTITTRLHISTSRVRWYTRPVDSRSEYVVVALTQDPPSANLHVTCRASPNDPPNSFISVQSTALIQSRYWKTCRYSMNMSATTY
jgi:hypothetical protein